MDDDHAALWAAESAACEPTAWERWVDELEAHLGHSADGDQNTDGYSMDHFYAQWKSGMTAAAAAASVTRRGDVEATQGG
ncbi:hypothetical protein H7J86_32670 [Mycobacterium hackensackense]|uniref:hypothetical protein n=1 Tax=Mycobacterium hackensackense TaxID=228909 RepID=UPI002265EAE6|nr:hypothetical protein [Mycobacterium hackensackense]MCV7256939.1 hypothetical protein [Mycobacterium hackensackense]